MASITYDGQSFMLDGRRVWLASGSINSARVPREEWPDRIQLARHAGLNCIETPIFWARHEPRQGQFDFSGDNDIRKFVELVGQAGMYCILRPGPFVGTGWDMGGLPPWLMEVSNINLRAPSQPFLEASSRYITALAQQVRDLQVTSAGQGGPIILIQNESAWTCGHDDLAHSYLGELNRYFREAGLTVPTINSNDLWQAVEGEIECWTGFDDMLSHLRQLASVRPNQPRMVIDFRCGGSDTWGRPADRTKTPNMVLRRLAEILAAGGQFNISPFHGGTNFDFSGGRLAGMPDGYITTSSDRGAPVTELGAPSPLYAPIRRISMFASRFARILANLDPHRQVVGIHPSTLVRSGAAKTSGVPGAGFSVIHASGAQGSVIFVCGDESGASTSQPTTLLLPDGNSLPIDLGNQPVGWYLLDGRVTGRATVDFSNLCPFAIAGRTYVCFGPAGMHGIISVNGSVAEIDVPKGKAPTVLEHEGLVLVIANLEQLDEMYIDADTVYLGVERPGRDGVITPIDKSYQRISGDGQVSTHKQSGTSGKAVGGKAAPVPGGHKLSLSEWQFASTAEHLSGESARYATIHGPASLSSLGAPYGYGWYRVKFKSGSARKPHVMAPGSGDRLHLFVDSDFHGVIGHGPGAAPECAVPLKKGAHTLVVLAENFGRAAAGATLGSPVGLHSHLWTVGAIKPEKPKLIAGDPIDILGFRAPLWHVHRGDTTDSHRLTWNLGHRKKQPILITVPPIAAACIVVLNDAPIAFVERGAGGIVVADPEKIGRGNNLVQIAVHGSTDDYAAELQAGVHFHEGDENLTAKAEWAFARWELPDSDAYLKVSKKDHPTPGQPVWWQCTFRSDGSHQPLLFDATGLTKGQIYLNNRHVGRYFVASADGKKVPPQLKYHVPRSWVDEDGPNELVIFDEHGGNPGKCRLIADAMGSAFIA